MPAKNRSNTEAGADRFQGGGERTTGKPRAYPASHEQARREALLALMAGRRVRGCHDGSSRQPLLRRGDQTPLELFLGCIRTWPTALLRAAKGFTATSDSGKSEG